MKKTKKIRNQKTKGGIKVTKAKEGENEKRLRGEKQKKVSNPTAAQSGERIRATQAALDTQSINHSFFIGTLSLDPHDRDLKLNHVFYVCSVHYQW